jgi:sugar-phosphatase
MPGPYDALLLDLYGTLVDDVGDAQPGAREALRAVASARYAVVTSCPLRVARRLLQMAELPDPPTLVTAEDVAHGKPAPDCYLLAAERLGVRPERCLVLEDTDHGVAAARAAGMDALLVGRGRSLSDLAIEVQKDGAIAVR